MTQREVLELIVRPVLADSLGMEKEEERGVWLPCTLKVLKAIEPEDFVDIAWRLERRCLKLGFKIKVDAKEIQNQRTTVADVVALICEKLGALEVPAAVVLVRAM